MIEHITNIANTDAVEGSDKGEFKVPHSIAIDSFGNLFVTDTANDRIQKFTSNGTFLMQFGNKTAFKDLEDIEIDSFDNIYVTDQGDSSIKKYTVG
jgi:DNA-binding beta-propeller fold protein YncE